MPLRAEVLLLDQSADAAKARSELGWSPLHPSLVHEFRNGNYRDRGDEMTHDNEAIVRHAYRTAEGDVLDVAGFVGSFAEDGAQVSSNAS
jgi:hypothetical protein